MNLSYKIKSVSDLALILTLFVKKRIDRQYILEFSSVETLEALVLEGVIGTREIDGSDSGTEVFLTDLGIQIAIACWTEIYVSNK